MGNQDSIIQVLNDLLKINKDRSEGYEKAAQEIFEFDLTILFRSMADESLKNASDLTYEITKLGGAVNLDCTTTDGELYQIWMDINAMLSGKDPHSILSLCEFGEDVTQRVYQIVLKNDHLPALLMELVVRQQHALKASHDTVKNYRDMEVETSQYN